MAVPLSPPVWVPPNPLRRPACTAQEASIVASCFTLGGQYCNALSSVRPTCQTCAIVDASSPTYGALVQTDPYSPAELNIPGCVSALTGDVSANSCGARLMAESNCELSACSQCADADLDACLDAAARTTCAAQYQAASCADGPLATCIHGNSLVDQATYLVSLFCM
jgi:hypothetical protein